MTISKEERQRNIEELLVMTSKTIGDDDALFTKYFCCSSYPQTLSTSWRHFLDNGLIKESRERGSGQFLLTPEGWRRGLELSGGFDDPVFRERLGRICGEARKIVGDRTRDELVHA